MTDTNKDSRLKALLNFTLNSTDPERHVRYLAIAQAKEHGLLDGANQLKQDYQHLMNAIVKNVRAGESAEIVCQAAKNMMLDTEHPTAKELYKQIKCS